MATDAQKRLAFLRFVLGQREGYIAVATINRRQHEKDKRFHEKFFSWPIQGEEITSYIDTHVARRDVYFCPHLFSHPKRTKQYAMNPSVLWADLEETPISDLLVKPTLIVHSSEGRTQALWKLHDANLPSLVEEYNKRITYFHASEGADKGGWDLTQLLRIPLTYNFKYDGPAQWIDLDADPELKFNIDDFGVYPDLQEAMSDDSEIPFELPDKTSSEILDDWKYDLNPRALMLFEEEPSGSWSEPLWELEVSLLESGLTPQEAFIVVKDAACNKYSREDRPDAHLWKDIVKAYKYVVSQRNAPPIPVAREDKFAPLLTDEERDSIASRTTFIEEYIQWASSLGDAAYQYHQAGAFIALSILMTGAVRLPTSFGTVLPNLWFMILADTTLTRKSTAMDIAVDLVMDVDDDALLATDGSIEGLLTSLSMRPGRPSVFLRDEFTGLIEQMAKRDYYSGMLETLTKLYDGKTLKRVLRKETIEVRDPILILFAGGIKSRMMELLRPEHVSSGFIPRFIFITAEADVTKLKPIGPPTESGFEGRRTLLKKLRKMYNFYWETSPNALFPKELDAELTQDAWLKYNQIETKMLSAAMESPIAELMTPMMDRLAKSGLKAAVLIAASRCEEKCVVTVEDILHSFKFVEQWREHALYLLLNIGSTMSERRIERVHTVIRNRPGVTKSEIMRNYKIDSRDMKLIIETLVQRALVKPERIGRGERYFPLEQ